MNDVIHSRARLILFRSLALLYEIVFHRRVEKPAIKIDRNRPISGTFNNNIFPLARLVGMFTRFVLHKRSISIGTQVLDKSFI